MARDSHPDLVHFALAVGGFAIGTTEFATMSLLPYFARDLGIAAPVAGHVISAYALGVVLGAPLIAVLAAKLPRRTLLIGLMLLFALGNGLTGLVPSYHAMLLLRFISGLPHGAYFGVAMLVAASLVPQERRAQASARVLMGLTVATIIGVPCANWLGQAIGWRWCFGIVAVLALLTATLVALFAPRQPPKPDASAMTELAALGNRDVWLTLAIGAIGFGGFFAIYTYLADTLLTVTHMSESLTPLVFAIFGAGMMTGLVVVPRFAHGRVMRVAGLCLLWFAATMALYSFATGNAWTITLSVFLIGLGGALGPILQTRLMDVAGKAQTLAAALNHSAFNFANALGPLVGGIAIAHGLGLSSTGLVGSSLALAGLAIWAVALKIGHQ
ncbi:MAG: MFS transporter [Alphaproteobacteria bacterium]|nr:MFS transporter [Alphaproteobacteria bacterium]